MKNKNIFKFLSISVLLFSVMLMGAACDSNPDNNAEDNSLGEAEYDEDSAMYPEEKVMDSTNLADGQPVDLNTGVFRLDKQKLLSTLNLHKTELENQVRALEAKPGDQSDESVIEGNIEKYKTYLEKLDREIAQVNAADEENFSEVVPSAQAAIKGAGALINTRDMRIN
ncbi:hypothetical protein OKW21_005450 [Catalinimonas alkaloidigena]|uniref:hypothetical protein n=1 Tax=Catalinimonas alkaloidigena TaxID=1075417 RepID=UPI002406364F|nr:hypothetical protein [Catalinimonas alkaloidigena]MDF9800187.1 hypothetical protein [Catalinimonas alkaloidigena]